MTGDYARGLTLAEETYRLGGQAEPENAEQTFHAQLLCMFREQGLLAGLVPVAEEMAGRYVAVPGWRCALAFVYVEADLADRAREIFQEMSQDAFRSIPRDLAWLGAHAYLAEVASYLGDSRGAYVLRGVMEPFSNHNCSLFDIASYGAVSHYLGLLAATMGDHDGARSYLEEAIAFNDATGQRPAAARSRMECARVQSRRGRSGRKAAATLLADAAAEASALGLERLRAQILPLASDGT